MIASVCKRHGSVACAQCSPKIELNQISIVGQCQGCKNSLAFCNCRNYQLSEAQIGKWNKALKELNRQPIQFMSVWHTDKVIDFVNWYIDLKELGENNKLENKTIIESFLNGDSVDVWKNIPEIFSFLRKSFTYDSEEEVFQSKKQKIGAGSGNDSSLFIASSNSGTVIWWKNNIREEGIIFDGKELKTEEEFNKVFQLLDILKWI